MNPLLAYFFERLEAIQCDPRLDHDGRAQRIRELDEHYHRAVMGVKP